VDINTFNRDGWDQRVAERDHWTLPVSPETIARAREGSWSVLLTSTKDVPLEWFGDLEGKDVLALASGGGQQGPVFAAAGARVTVFDASERQLAGDRMVADRDRLELTTVQGYMHDLSAFEPESFDLIFHPVSNCYAPHVPPVWKEAFRVLRPGGTLLSGFMTPASYIFDALAEDRGELILKHPLPYADNKDLPDHEREEIARECHTFEFSHTLDDQIGGQLAAGFLLSGFYEDCEPKRLVAQYFPDMIATRAIKPLLTTQ
jgi:SAM-dependent methyltransferase